MRPTSAFVRSLAPSAGPAIGPAIGPSPILVAALTLLASPFVNVTSARAADPVPLPPPPVASVPAPSAGPAIPPDGPSTGEVRPAGSTDARIHDEEEAKTRERIERENAERRTRTDVTPRSVSPEATVAALPTAGNFMDTRLTWTFGDDDILHATGQVQPLSPTANIGDRPQYKLFFDSLNSQYAGRENLTHLVMYKKMPGFIENLELESALVLTLDATALQAQSGNVNQALYDAGSYLRIFYKTGYGEHAKEGLSLVFFPIDTDRFRLGYLYDISWGGTNAATNQSMFPGIQGQSPGMKVQYDGRGWYAFGGFKTAQINEIERTFVSNDNNNVQQINVAETNYAFLGGAGADVLPQLHFDVSGGYFQQGRFDTPDLIPPPNVDQSPPRVFTFGGSARIVIHDGMPAPQSVDFLLYRNDPSAPMLMFQQEKYSKDQFAYAIALEGTRLEQNLHDGSSDAAGNVRTGATTLQGANAAALSAQFKIGDARVGVFGIYRDLAYINRNQPGNPPFEAFTQADHLQSEIFLAGTLAYYIESLHMMPGIGGGIQLPAADTATLNIGNVEVDRATIFRKQGDIAILPEGAGRRAIIQTRVSLRWDLSTAFAAIGWLQLIHDPNQNQLESDPTTQAVLIRTFQSPNFFGFGMTLQARY